jgi:aminoglycoside phosphotransferase (APT) family kinase protein
MTPLGATLDRGDAEAALSGALREAHGADARLEGWTADAHFTEHGKRRVVRYDLHARVPGVPGVRHYRWVGKRYDRDEDAHRVATVLRDLAATDCGSRGGLVLPGVLAYYAPGRLLLMTYEAGEAVAPAIAHSGEAVLTALGRALAALHATPVSLDAIRSPAAVLDDVRPRIADLCAWFPDEAGSLRDALVRLERDAPRGPAAPAFVHGDFGPANLLWRAGELVVLDFDKCTRGDPALDLGNLLTQLRRITLRRPGTLPDFASMRSVLLDAYERSARPDPGLVERVAWYERATQVRKIHFLVSDTTRHQEAEAIRRRQAEGIGLMRCIRDESASVRSF